MTTISGSIKPELPKIPDDLANKLENIVYAQKNIESDGKPGLSQAEISAYLQDTYGTDSKTADKIAALAIRKSGGDISNGAELASALGLDTLEKTTKERLQDALSEIKGGKPSADTARIDLLEKLVNAEIGRPVPPIIIDPVVPLPKPVVTPYQA